MLFCYLNAGISTLELLLGQLFVLVTIVLLMCFEMVTIIGIFYYEGNRGSNITVIGLIFLMGLVGMMTG